MKLTNGLTAVIEAADEGGIWAYCVEMPGANGQGETLDEVVADLEAAIELMLEVMESDPKPIC